jgi:hypothetical protein
MGLVLGCELGKGVGVAGKWSATRQPLAPACLPLQRCQCLCSALEDGVDFMSWRPPLGARRVGASARRQVARWATHPPTPLPLFASGMQYFVRRCAAFMPRQQNSRLPSPSGLG